MADPGRRLRARAFLRDWPFEVLALAAVIVPAVLLLQVWSQLPATVPTHFNAAGDPDDFGPKSGLRVLWLAQLGLWVLLTASQLVPVRFMNLPTKVTPENRAHVARVAQRGIAALKVIVSLTFALITYGSVNVALGRTSELSVWVLLLGTLGVLPVLVWMVVAVQRPPASTR